MCLYDYYYFLTLLVVISKLLNKKYIICSDFMSNHFKPIIKVPYEVWTAIYTWVLFLKLYFLFCTYIHSCNTYGCPHYLYSFLLNFLFIDLKKKNVLPAKCITKQNY